MEKSISRPPLSKERSHSNIKYKTALARREKETSAAEGMERY